MVDAVGVVRRLRLHAADDRELVGHAWPSSAGTRRPAVPVHVRSGSGGTARRSAGRASCRTCRSGWPRRSSTAGCSACRCLRRLGGDRWEWNSPPQLATTSPAAGDQRALQQAAAAEVLVRGQLVASVVIASSDPRPARHVGLLSPLGLCCQWLNRNSPCSAAPRSPPRPAPRPSVARQVRDEPLPLRRPSAGGSAPTGTAARRASPTAPSSVSDRVGQVALAAADQLADVARCCSGTGARCRPPWKSPWPLVGSPK